MPIEKADDMTRMPHGYYIAMGLALMMMGPLYVAARSLYQTGVIPLNGNTMMREMLFTKCRGYRPVRVATASAYVAASQPEFISIYIATMQGRSTICRSTTPTLWSPLADRISTMARRATGYSICDCALVHGTAHALLHAPANDEAIFR